MDKSTGKDYFSGATNVRLGQHGQLISPPLGDKLTIFIQKKSCFLFVIKSQKLAGQKGEEIEVLWNGMLDKSVTH